MEIQQAIGQLIEGQDLNLDEANAVMRILMSGEATHAQISAFLIAMRMKGETVDEIAGLAKAMRSLATRVETARKPLVDTCGTGGDHSGTFNISTAAAFVVAGAGVAVAKHGNRSATSRCGSADVLEELGVNVSASPETVGKCIDELGIGFLFARTLHGAMKHVAPVRGELGVRTVFNILGPLTNPAGADGQLMGVFAAELVEPIAEVLAKLGARHAFVVCGSDGLDEITLSGPTKVAEAKEGRVEVYEITPGQFGIEPAPGEALKGGDAAENATLLRHVLQGSSGPHRDVVLLNAAAAIVAGQRASGLAEGIARAGESIDSGAALQTLETLRSISHEGA